MSYYRLRKLWQLLDFRAASSDALPRSCRLFDSEVLIGSQTLYEAIHISWVHVVLRLKCQKCRKYATSGTRSFSISVYLDHLFLIEWLLAVLMMRWSMIQRVKLGPDHFDELGLTFCKDSRWSNWSTRQQTDDQKKVCLLPLPVQWPFNVYTKKTETKNEHD